MNKIRPIIEKLIVVSLLIVTIIYGTKDISLGIYFGVLTNVVVNVLYTANILQISLPKKRKNKSKFGFTPYD